jgi:glyoxylase-like metal-dependent hydrolase (beta-lactamase superfamily II)
MAPGVLRLQLPIQMPGLGHVNCYAIPDGDGVAIVDPGLPGPASWKVLQQRLDAAGVKVNNIHTVLITHAHPDHFGNAGRLANEADAELITHSAFRTWWSQTPNDPCDEVYDVDPEDLEQENPFDGGRTPWGGENMRHNMPIRRRIMYRLMRSRMGSSYTPTPTRRVRNGETLKLGGREWTAVHTPGHTLDHLCLYDPTEGTLLSGDHVLPTITPHISGQGSGRDPLKAFVDSLEKVAQLPYITKVLPAHGHPFTDLRGRVDSIKEHHVERMEQLRQASIALGPATVADLSHELFRPAVWGPMAESETYAHLEHLRLAGQAERHDRDGVMIYKVSA